MQLLVGILSISSYMVVLYLKQWLYNRTTHTSTVAQDGRITGKILQCSIKY